MSTRDAQSIYSGRISALPIAYQPSYRLPSSSLSSPSLSSSSLSSSSAFSFTLSTAARCKSAAREVPIESASRSDTDVSSKTFDAKDSGSSKPEMFLARLQRVEL